MAGSLLLRAVRPRSAREYDVNSPDGPRSVLRKIIVIDVFDAESAGLVVAEIEVLSEGHVVELSPWVGEEVTADRRYNNAALVENPYCRWKR